MKNSGDVSKIRDLRKAIAEYQGPPQKWASDGEKAVKIDMMRQLEHHFFEIFGESLWIPRQGISKSGNIYITLVLKMHKHLDRWYASRKGYD